MAHEILTPDEMAELDRQAIAAGPLDGYGLMRNAGRAVAAEVLGRYGGTAGVDVLCGPGNNGGDGYVVARLLAEAGVDVGLWVLAAPAPGSDAARAARDCPLAAGPLPAFRPRAGRVVVDALFGAGLTRPLAGAAAVAVEALLDADLPVVAVDLPSGLDGRTGHPLGQVLEADVTVTFVRRKPAHLLEPGRALCGETVVADIGMPRGAVAALPRSLVENRPALWRAAFPVPSTDTHKYRRGHVGVLSGGPTASGAARLAALAAARAGAGAVTLLSPGAALQVNAAHLTAVMLRRADAFDAVAELIDERPGTSFVAGPGFGTGDALRQMVDGLLAAGRRSVRAVVLDADALTSFAGAPAALFQRTAAAAAPASVLTPHEGEFARLFADLAAAAGLSKVERARLAAARSGCVVVLKGPDTVIAAPDGRAAINVNGTPLLATAGSGDVLAGLIAGLAAQMMPPFEAACAAVWLHAEAARHFGPGLIADDLPGALPAALRALADG